MKTRNGGFAMTILAGAMALSQAGCERAQQAPSRERERPAAAAAPSEIQRLAETVLGSQAEVLAQGNLIRNGLKQVLVVDRVNRPPGEGLDGGKDRGIFITRAAVLQKTGEKWTEALRCDEHLKNPNGYLEGSPLAPVTGWRFEYRPDPQGDLELLFTPVGLGAHQQGLGLGDASGGRSIAVKWNTKTKRFQAFDRSHERFLGEVPALETPQSVLR
jgi:hypothetical protein